jgi:hypothetical protein
LVSSLFLDNDPQGQAITHTAHGLIERFYAGVPASDWPQAEQAIRQHLASEAWQGSVLSQVFAEPDKFLMDDYRFVKFPGEKKHRLLRVIPFSDLATKFADEFAQAPQVKKTAPVRVETIQQPEKRWVIQDQMVVEVEPGDHWIKNPSDGSGYRFSNLLTLEQRKEHFRKSYQPVAGQPGTYLRRGTFKVIQVMDDFVLATSWGPTMTLKAGGYLADGGYVIQADSFDDYDTVDNGAKIPSVSLNGLSAKT